MKYILSLLIAVSAACQSTRDASASMHEHAKSREHAAIPAHAATQSSEQHAWLQQLVGEWTATMEMTMGPGSEPTKSEATESVRAIGGTWIVAEGQMDVQGVPTQSVMTLGYDPNQSAYVGTWIDTMHNKLWVYNGRLDAAERVLTLETEGPSMMDPTRTTLYRDAIEVIDANHKTLTSSIRGDDGTWTTFVRADYRRKN